MKKLLVTLISVLCISMFTGCDVVEFFEEKLPSIIRPPQGNTEPIDPENPEEPENPENGYIKVDPITNGGDYQFNQ